MSREVIQYEFPKSFEPKEDTAYVAGAGRGFVPHCLSNKNPFLVQKHLQPAPI